MRAFINNLFFLRFLSNFPKVILVPYFAFWLIHFENISAAHAGVVVGSYILTYRAGALLFSRLIVKYHPKLILIFCSSLLMFLHALLFALGIYEISYFLLLVATAFLIGSAISIISILILSYIGTMKEIGKHAALFSYLNMAFNLSAGIGPVLGSYVLHQYPEYLPLAPCVFIMIGLLLSFYLPPIEISDRMAGEKYGYKNLFTNIPLLKFTAISSISLFGYACFYDLFPLYSHEFYALSTIGLLFLTSCFIIVIFQIPVKKYIIDRTQKNDALFIANMLLATAVLLMFYAGRGHLLIAIVAIVCLSFSEMIFLPIYQTKALDLSGSVSGVFAMSLLSATWGLSEAIAASSGTYLIAHHFSFLFFGICAFLCACVAIYFKTSQH